MSAAFQYNLKRRPFLGPYTLLAAESELKTHNKRLKGNTFRIAPLEIGDVHWIIGWFCL
jgi:hypothetical protein